MTYPFIPAPDHWSRNGVLPYIAGFIDGEGCITIGKKYNVAVTLGQVDRRPLDFIKDHFDGHLAFKAGSGNWRDAWTLTIHGRTAAALLRAVLPYLIVKREQAELAIAVMAIKRTGPIRPALSGWEVAERESYRLALLDLRRAA